MLPGTPGVDATAFAQRLAQALHWLGRIELVQADTARHRGAGWFSRMEQDADGLIYVGDTDPLWRERCVRQSDAVLMLADTDDKPANALPTPACRSPHTPLQLVLQRRYPPQPGETGPGWKPSPIAPAITICAMTRHGPPGAPARWTRHRAMLSGGGARDSRISVYCALREHGVEVDYVGAQRRRRGRAGIAAGWDEAQLVEALRIAFVDDNPLSDRTLPLVAMSSGAGVAAAAADVRRTRYR